MDYQERITEIEKEITELDLARLVRIDKAQIFQAQIQNELSEIHDAVLTRQGEIIGLKRLIAEANEGSHVADIT